MARFVEPERWDAFYAAISAGHSKTTAARMAGIYLGTVNAGLSDHPRSSIHAYRKWKAAHQPCPCCGRNCA